VSIASVYRHGAVQDMLLRHAEVQYVCRHAARQSTVDQVAADAAYMGIKPMLERRKNAIASTQRSNISPWLIAL
jgi:hypothetical protein